MFWLPLICGFSLVIVSAFYLWTSLGLSVIPRLGEAEQKSVVAASPRDTLLLALTVDQRGRLPYPSDLIPGAREVATPYGTMRVYEWGPTDGRKVLFVHGDTTPSPVLAPIAKALAGRGCRVMLFDLWGRGYTDSPLKARHDAALYTTQIFYALTSSPIPWTGSPQAFSMIGFSSGGAITMTFASRFAYLLQSVVLLAPAGLLRDIPKEYQEYCWRYHFFLPKWYLRRRLANLLGVKLTGQSIGSDGNLSPSWTHAETQIDSAAITQWQFDHHRGFQHSFIDSINHGPLQNQHADWRQVFAIVSGDVARTRHRDKSSGLFDSKILFVFGDDDSVVVGEQVTEDVKQLLHDRGRIVVRGVPGGHGFPVPSADKVVQHIEDFWDLKQSR